MFNEISKKGFCECEEGYEGPQCQKCEVGYQRRGSICVSVGDSETKEGAAASDYKYKPAEPQRTDLEDKKRESQSRIQRDAVPVKDLNKEEQEDITQQTSNIK